MNEIIIIRYNKKTKQLTKPDSTWSHPLTQYIEIPITLNDFVTPGKVGFDAMHEKLDMLATMHKFDVKGMLTALATTAYLRPTHLVRRLGIPPFVTTMIFNLLRDSNACIGGGSSVRKTSAYVDFLRHVITPVETLATVTSGRKTEKYIIPNDVDEMSTDMLMEELRLAEEFNAKPTIMDKLRKIFHCAQQTAKEEERKKMAKPGKKLTELEQILVDNKIQEQQEAEYDDVPPTKKRRK